MEGLESLTEEILQLHKKAFNLVQSKLYDVIVAYNDNRADPININNNRIGQLLRFAGGGHEKVTLESGAQKHMHLERPLISKSEYQLMYTALEVINKNEVE